MSTAEITETATSETKPAPVTGMVCRECSSTDITIRIDYDSYGAQPPRVLECNHCNSRDIVAFCPNCQGFDFDNDLQHAMLICRVCGIVLKGAPPNSTSLQPVTYPWGLSMERERQGTGNYHPRPRHMITIEDFERM